MKFFYNIIRKNLARSICLVTTSSYLFTNNIPKVRCEEKQNFIVNFENLEDSKKIKDFFDQDLIVVIDLDILIDKYIDQAKGILEQIRKAYPDCKIISIKSEQKKDFNIEKVSDETFVVLKRKNQNQIQELKHSDFFFQSQMIQVFFEKLKVIQDFSQLNLTKFNYLIGFCEENQEAENFIKKLQGQKEFINQEVDFYKFDSCQNLNSTNQDLIVLKKNSKFNSTENQETVVLNEFKFDIGKIENAFSQKNQIEKFTPKIVQTLKQMCVFSPNFFQQMDLNNAFDAILQTDENKISNRKKHELMSQIKKLKQKMDPELRDQINFYYSKENLQKDQLFNFKISNNEKIKLSHFYYSFNKDKNNLKMLLKKFPELVEKPYENYTYEFPLDKQELNLANFIQFFKKVKDQKILCQTYSEESEFDKFSNKLVYDNFQTIFQDENDHAVFFYSRNCHMCKKVQYLFEKECLENLKNSKYKNLKFHRINNDLNSFYMSTPVLIYFKNDQMNPYVFDTQHLTKDSVKNFIENCNKIEITKLKPEIFNRDQKIN